TRDTGDATVLPAGRGQPRQLLRLNIDALRHGTEARRRNSRAPRDLARDISWSLGIGDGLLSAEEETFPVEPLHEDVVGQLGGIDGLFEQIAWYQGALSGSSDDAAAA
ncbi:MAG TPA: hypothetical protein QF624_07280, partial [Dehalococcoidia bacterium]|nr:hypothetical protein [Dehalococcoidia bacterium]